VCRSKEGAAIPSHCPRLVKKDWEKSGPAGSLRRDPRGGMHLQNREPIANERLTEGGKAAKILADWEKRLCNAKPGSAKRPGESPGGEMVKR